MLRPWYVNWKTIEKQASNNQGAAYGIFRVYKSNRIDMTNLNMDK